MPDFDVSYGELEDPLNVMKRGYRISMLFGILGFILISYFLLNPLAYPSAWLCFTFCGILGTIIAYLFIDIT